jgi:hypothetical protein
MKSKKKGGTGGGVFGITSNLDTFNSQKVGLAKLSIDPRIKDHLDGVAKEKVSSSEQDDKDTARFLQLIKEYTEDTSGMELPGKPVPVPPM